MNTFKFNSTKVHFVFSLLFTLVFFGTIFSGCKKETPPSPEPPSDTITTTNNPPASGPSKIYVANEDEETISIIDGENTSNVQTINVADGTGNMLMVHNIQVAPNGKTVWVTANAMSEIIMDQVIVIDQSTNAITKRIYVGADYHLAHVIFDAEGKFAFVSATEGNVVVQIDAATFEIVKTISLGSGHSPHGMRYNKGELFVANMDAKGLSVIDVASGQITDLPLGGIAVQSAACPNGKYIFVSLYDTKEVVRYNTETGQILKTALPSQSQGPIQLYPTADSKKILVCDQGVLMGRPSSDKVFVIDVTNFTVTGTITVGNAAHGIVVSKDGKTAYVTNSSDNTVSIIDIASQTVTATVPVGLNPNGISYWYTNGGMP